jgi:two-component system, NarL family, response regulator
LSTSQPITVMLVDDHPVVREGLHAMISAEKDMKVVGQAKTGAEALSLWAELRPMIVLMDLLLPDTNGAEVIRRICEKSSSSHVVVLTSVCGDEDIYKALESGARGFLFKDMVREMLVGAIREVHAGRRYLPAQVGARMAENFPRPGLSSREIEILRLVATGLKNKEIAGKLDISEATVNSHVKHILEKLGASDRTHAVTSALRRGIIRL